MADAAISKRKSGRDTSRDGLRNRFEFYLATNFRAFWEFVNRTPFLARIFNYLVVNNAVRKGPARPFPLSTFAPYTSWQSLTDRTYFARYLPPREATDLPPIEKVTELFAVGPDGPTLSERSTLLLPVFAQWFTDSFLLTDDYNRLRTKTPHQVDLNPVYGMSPDVTNVLRLRSEAAGQRGRLKTETVNGEEWAPRLYDSAGVKKPEFAIVPPPLRLPAQWPAEKRAALFAFGGERANSSAFTSMMNTLFIREHNRLCRVLESAHPSWDDERVFQTACNINIVQLIRIVVEEYINHMSNAWFRCLSDPKPCYRAEWNRPNWIPIEFNLLYRWHSFVPEYVAWNGEAQPMESFFFDNTALLREGLARGFDNASRTRSWKLGLFNTARFLLPVEADSIRQGRECKLATYNDYREVMQYPRLTRFEQINSNPRVVDALRRLYGHVDKIEYFVGLFAEEVPPRLAVTPIIQRMVSVDAFSHALTNPLLAPLIFNAETFSSEGMEVIQAIATLKDVVERNIAKRPNNIKVTMEFDGNDDHAPTS
ncbi:MAG: peroxidase family protein [Methylocella sp.]